MRSTTRARLAHCRSFNGLGFRPARLGEIVMVDGPTNRFEGYLQQFCEVVKEANRRTAAGNALTGIRPGRLGSGDAA